MRRPPPRSRRPPAAASRPKLKFKVTRCRQSPPFRLTIRHGGWGDLVRGAVLFSCRAKIAMSRAGDGLSCADKSSERARGPSAPPRRSRLMRNSRRLQLCSRTAAASPGVAGGFGASSRSRGGFGSRRETGQAMVRLMPYRLKRPDSRRRCRADLRFDRQTPRLHRELYRAIPDAVPSQDAGRPLEPRRGAGSRRLHRNAGALIPSG